VPQAEALVERKHRVLTVEVDGDPLTVWSAPSNTEGRCAWFEYRKRTGQVYSCWPRGDGPDVVSAAIVHLAGARFLLGQAPPQAASVDVTLEGGRTIATRPVEGVLIVPLGDGDAPSGVAGRDAQGRDVISIPLPPRPIVMD
jgi:hypothetical protein